MCLNTRQKKANIATEDIVVYKNEGSYSQEEFYSSFGHVYKVMQECKKVQIKARKTGRNWDRTLLDVDEGYHSYKDLSSYNRKGVFIIPKGAKYFEGNHNGWDEGYTSSQLVYMGEATNSQTEINITTFKNRKIVEKVSFIQRIKNIFTNEQKKEEKTEISNRTIDSEGNIQPPISTALLSKRNNSRVSSEPVEY